MIRKRKLYQRPRKAHEKVRVAEENKLMEKYGLKNKIEIWKSIAKLKYFRDRAKDLAKRPLDEQEVLFNKLKLMGLKTDTIADVLALKIEDILERRLPTIVFKKGIATTAKQARQMVSHKRIMISGNVVNIPSYLVPVSEEDKIELRKAKPAKKKEETKVEESKSTEVVEAAQNG